MDEIIALGILWVIFYVLEIIDHFTDFTGTN
jgi:hypothetical protein